MNRSISLRQRYSAIAPSIKLAWALPKIFFFFCSNDGVHLDDLIFKTNDYPSTTSRQKLVGELL